MPAATRWRRAGTLGAASGGLEGSEACPLMLLQQSAQLGVIRSQGSLCVIHTAMIVDREDVRQTMRPGSAYATAGDGHSVPIGRRASVLSFRTMSCPGCMPPRPPVGLGWSRSAGLPVTASLATSGTCGSAVGPWSAVARSGTDRRTMPTGLPGSQVAIPKWLKIPK